MKKILLFLVASFVVISNFAQTNIPQLVSFSAVVRDANNLPLVNTPVSIRLTFKQGGQSGPLVYCALHQNTTNQNGFISIQLNREVLGIGCNGAPSTAFQNIPWENGGFWMEVEYQTVPGSPFVNLGQLELASSFYAFAAGTAERIASITTSGAQNGDILVYNSTTGKFEPGQSGITSVQWADVQNKPNFATVATSGDYGDLINQPSIPTVPANVSEFTNDAGYITVDNDNQQLSVSSMGDTLKLQNGGFVIIPGIGLANLENDNLNYFFDNRDSSIYMSVVIGNQEWMAENLRFLPSVNHPSSNSVTDPCYYVFGYWGSNLVQARRTYNYQSHGVLYNWQAALNACPTGWHLPSNDEWNELINYVGGESVAGSMLKQAGTLNWTAPNVGANDSFYFNALPSGYLNGSGSFAYFKSEGYWWTSTEKDLVNIWYVNFYYNGSIVYRNENMTKDKGLSIRCVKD